MMKNYLVVLLALAGVLPSVAACNSKSTLLMVRDADIDQPAQLDTGNSGGNGAGGIAAAGGSGGIGADAKERGDVSTGSDGIGAGGVGGTSTGGSGAGGIGAGGAGGTSTGGSGGLAMGGSGGGGGIDGGGGGSAIGGNGDAGLGGSGGQKDASVGGAGGVSLTGGAAGGKGGTNGTGGSSASSCPPVAPANGAACNQYFSCFYEDCTGSGRTVANCTGTNWQVSTGTCGITSCTGLSGGTATCPPGQVCLALWLHDPACVSPTCGSGPLTQDCVPGAVGFCYIGGTVADGISLFCCPYPGTAC